MRSVWWLGLAAVGASMPAAAQSPRVPALIPAPAGSELTISLMTMGVGARVWEMFGHNAILVEDRSRGTAIAYNYGMFDFRQENFLWRFIQGRMRYWMQGFDLAPTLEIYRRANRSVWVQELSLSPQQRLALRDFLEWNERPENRYYRYDYYRDNCSTRVRDALDRVLQGQLRSETDTIRTSHTYRSHTKRLTSSDPLLYTGLLVGLAQPADHPLTAWEEMFVPLELRAWVRHVHVSDATGGEVPLVRSERVLFQASQPDPPADPPQWLPGYLVIGLAIGGALWWMGSRASARDWRGKVFLFLAMVWTLTTGIAGSLLAFLWAFTDHAVAYRNENLFQANLLALALVVLIPGWKRGEAWATRPAIRLAVLVAAVSVLGGIVKVLPMFYQDNVELLALAVPAHLGLAAGLLASSGPIKG